MSSSPDLTARARIREAAIALFAERGINGATIRDIAEAAGVSSGLLRHHFGSKEGLRDACDDWVMAELARIRAPYLNGSGSGGQGLLDAIQAAPLVLQTYVVRSTMDGSPTGTKMFERMVDEGERWLATTPLKSADPRAYSAVLVALKMGMYLLRDQISEAIGADTRTPAGQARMFRAAVEIFAQPMLSADLADQACAVLDRLISSSGEAR